MFSTFVENCMIWSKNLLQLFLTEGQYDSRYERNFHVTTVLANITVIHDIIPVIIKILK